MDIPEDEFQFSFSRAGGPGGQNVNKVSTKVTLKWAFKNSAFLTDEEKIRIACSPVLKNRINSQDEIVLYEAGYRTQLQNREQVVEKLQEMVSEALKVRRTRRKSKVPRGKKEARLEDKRQTKRKKELRQRVREQD